MPPAPTTDFSYAQDVQPYASRFFDRIDASSTLSHGAKMSIQSTLLNGMEDIQAQRTKLQEERDQGRARTLAYEDTAFRLENARAARTRAEQQESRRAGVTGMAKSILDGKGDPETKRQMLARTALDFADDKDALGVFDVAERALPKEKERDGLTPFQVADFTSRIGDHVAAEDIPAVMSNPMLLGQVLSKVMVEEKKKGDAKRLADDATKDGIRLKDSLAEKPLTFYNPPLDKLGLNDADKDGKSRVHDADGKPRWLDDESTETAKRMVYSLGGSPEEIKEFEELGKDASSDRARYRLAENIKLRYLLSRARGGGGSEPNASPAAKKAFDRLGR